MESNDLMSVPRVISGDITEEEADHLISAGELSVDCEMMGLNPFRDRLCLIQIYREGAPSLLIRPDEKNGMPNVRRVFESASVQKIFHFARMDTHFLDIRLGIQTTNIFCTKIASKLARTYTERHSLKDLVKEFTGESMDKSSQSSDWGRAELTREQIAYADMDVKYLFHIKRALSAMLERENRMDLARRAFQFLETQRELDREGFLNLFEF